MKQKTVQLHLTRFRYKTKKNYDFVHGMLFSEAEGFTMTQDWMAVTSNDHEYLAKLREQPCIHNSEIIRVDTGEKLYMYWMWENPHQKRKIFIQENSYWREILYLHCMLADLQAEDKVITHQKTHTAQKPQGCRICGNSFNRKAHFQLHRLIHTGEKPIYELTVGRTSLTGQM